MNVNLTAAAPDRARMNRTYDRPARRRVLCGRHRPHQANLDVSLPETCGVTRWGDA